MAVFIMYVHPKLFTRRILPHGALFFFKPCRGMAIMAHVGNVWAHNGITDYYVTISALHAYHMSDMVWSSG